MNATRIITVYETHCEDQELAVPSNATLYKIVKTCAESHIFLKGLESYTTDGMTAIETLEKIVCRLKEKWAF